MYLLLSTELVGSDSAKKEESQLKIGSSLWANEQALAFPLAHSPLPETDVLFRK